MRPWALPLSLLVLSLASDAAATPKRKVVDRIVAVVDDACITKGQLERYAAPYERAAAQNVPATELAVIALRVRREALNGLIDVMLLEREATRLGFITTDDEIERAIESVAQANKLTREGVLAAAADQGVDVARYRAELRSQILEGKLLQIEAPKRNPDWSVLNIDAKGARLTETRVALVAELRARAFVEVRL